MASSVASVVHTVKFNIPDEIYPVEYEYKTLYENSINSTFCKELAEKIENDIHNKYYVYNEVVAETNMQSLKLTVFIRGDSTMGSKVKNYIESKYCTPNDVVILKNEI